MLFQALADRVCHHSVTRRIVVLVSEYELVQIPASGLALRALVLHRKKGREKRDETLALSGAPIAPHEHLLRIYCVMDDLRGPGIDDHTERDVPLLELLPKQGYLGFFLREAGL